jgi:hypothetical protein
MMKPYQTELRQSTEWKGKTKNKRKGPTSKLENKNPRQGGQVKGVGKSHVPYPYHKKHVRKG